MSRRLVNVLTVYACLTAHIAVGDESALQRRFIAEAPIAWREFRALVGNSECAVTWKRVYSSAGSPSKKQIEIVHRVVQRQAGLESMREVWRQGSARFPENVLARNELYSFKLGRKESTSPWTLVGLGKPDEFDGDFTNDLRPILEMPLLLFGVLLPDLCLDPDFHISSMSESADGGVTLAFTFTPPDEARVKKAAGLMHLRSGECELSPSRFWSLRSYRAVRRFDFHGKEMTVIGEARFSYEITDEHAPPILREVNETSDDGYVGTWSFESFRYQPPSSGEFRLVDYGIPEPKLLGDSPSRRAWLVWVLVGIVFVIAGIAYRRRHAAG